MAEFVEVPARFLSAVPNGGLTIDADERVCIVQLATMAFVTDPRADERGVPALLEHVRTLVPAGKHVTWFIGPSARPATLADELVALGLHTPYDGVDRYVAMALSAEPPPSPPNVVVREIETYEDYVTMAELTATAFGQPPELREKQRERLPDAFAKYCLDRGRSTVSFVAEADGEPAATATALLTERGLFLIGGATAEAARGRGLYRALVRARWDYAVARGTPVLTVHANPATSFPILVRAGFEAFCELVCLEGL